MWSAIWWVGEQACLGGWGKRRWMQASYLAACKAQNPRFSEVNYEVYRSEAGILWSCGYVACCIIALSLSDIVQSYHVVHNVNTTSKLYLEIYLNIL